MSEPLVNSHFEGFPKDYFKIEKDNFVSFRGFENGNQAADFLESELSNISKEILELDSNGYIRDSLLQKLDYEIKDTTVINCAVGQGKTSSLLRSITEYYEQDKNTFFIIAVPLLSLIAQYQKDLIDLGINENEIFNYEKIGKSFEQGGLDYNDLRRRIHLVTVNTLLGNPGDNAVLASKAKSKYLKEFTNNLSSKNKKVVLVFDEIHEAISNFSKSGIIHLFYWERILQKILVLSATYNVASISVIHLLSKLTENKINILESDRIVKRPQSRLFLHYDNSEIYDSSNITLNQIIDKTISEDKSLDIISFSKKLAKSIISNKKELGRKLIEKYGELKDCTSDLFQNQSDSDEVPKNRFNNDYTNIGTNFKSGVSIEKENHSLIIILPHNKSRRTYRTENGIFTEGVNSIIQALARQRNIGDIHIIMPSPLEFEYDSLTNMPDEEKRIFISAYDNVKILNNRIQTRNNVEIQKNKLILFEQHFPLVREKYEESASRLLIPIMAASHKNLEFPDLSEFILEKSELALTEIGFLGKDLSSFTTYSAFTNQFYNAKLHEINIINIEDTDEDGFPGIVEQIYNNYNSYSFNSGKNIQKKSEEILKLIFEKSKNNFSKKDKSRYKKRTLEILLSKEGSSDSNSNNLAYNYLMNYLSNQDVETNNSPTLKFKRYIKKLQDSILKKDDFEYFANYKDSKLFEDESEEILNLVNNLKQNHTVLGNRNNNFFRNINNENAGFKMFNFLKKALFETTRYQKRENNKIVSYDKITVTKNVTLH